MRAENIRRERRTAPSCFADFTGTSMGGEFRQSNSAYYLLNSTVRCMELGYLMKLLAPHGTSPDSLEHASSFSDLENSRLHFQFANHNLDVIKRSGKMPDPDLKGSQV